ncbi:MAG: DoxX family protein [Gordonia sp. (in: high G+C Gram-positive bacteria)]|uniref:DoxX family protein n=1 Tax=Gordonia sp. (in: high G+C Gram-positive bacteria) TaxID=84139 RepID=UPI0039E3CF91
MNRLQQGQSVATTIARVILGIIFIAHGWQKFFTNGIDNVATGFEAMGVPMPTFSAWFAGLAELVGGAALIVGVAVPLVSVVLIIDMIGAILTAHVDQGFWASDGGYEFCLALIAGLVAVGFASQGKLSVDGNVLAARGRH